MDAPQKPGEDPVIDVWAPPRAGVTPPDGEAEGKASHRFSWFLAVRHWLLVWAASWGIVLLMELTLSRHKGGGALSGMLFLAAALLPPMLGLSYILQTAGGAERFSWRRVLVHWLYVFAGPIVLSLIMGATRIDVSLEQMPALLGAFAGQFLLTALVTYLAQRGHRKWAWFVSIWLVSSASGTLMFALAFKSPWAVHNSPFHDSLEDRSKGPGAR